MPELTPKQQRFVEEYLVDLNATQAAIRAGYSEKTAYRTGADNLKKPQIAEEIDKAMKKRGNRTQHTADDVLVSLTRLAKKAERCKDLTNAIRANELLGKHHRLFTDRVEHSGQLDIAQKITDARKRVGR